MWRSNFFYAYNISINSLTLVGMALAIGMLVDNSVVVLENIYRLAGQGKDPETAVKQGTTEVWRSIFASTLTTVIVFLPFIFSDNFLVKMIGKNIGVFHNFHPYYFTVGSIAINTDGNLLSSHTFLER